MQTPKNATARINRMKNIEVEGESMNVLKLFFFVFGKIMCFDV